MGLSSSARRELDQAVRFGAVPASARASLERLAEHYHSGRGQVSGLAAKRAVRLYAEHGGSPPPEAFPEGFLPATPDPPPDSCEVRTVCRDAVSGRLGTGEALEGPAPPTPLPALGGYVGAPCEVLYPAAIGVRALPARYGLVPAQMLRPSHSPFSFEPTPDYRPNLQERNYETSPRERAKVELAAREGVFRAEFLVNTNPDAINGPPVVLSSTGEVIGGNGRTMIVQRVLRYHPQSYTAELARALSESAAYGLHGVPLAGLVLVRLVEEGRVDLGRASRALNQPLTQALDDAAEAVSFGSLLSPGALRLLTETEGTTPRARINRAGAELVSELRASGIITAQTEAQWLRRNGTLKPEAKSRVEDALLGAVVPDAAALEQSAPAVLKWLRRVAPELGRLRSLGEEHDLTRALRAVMPELAAISHLTRAQVAERYKTPDLFRELSVSSELEAQVLAWAYAKRKSLKRSAEALRAYADRVESARRPGLFGARDEVSPDELRKEVLGFRSVPQKYSRASAWREWLARAHGARPQEIK